MNVYIRHGCALSPSDGLFTLGAKCNISGPKINNFFFKRPLTQMKLSKWLESSWNHLLLLTMMSYLWTRLQTISTALFTQHSQNPLNKSKVSLIENSKRKSGLIMICLFKMRRECLERKLHFILDT